MNDLAQRVLLAAAAGADEPVDEIAEGILDAALQHLEVHGIARSSVEDIAKRAKVARVTVYRRFAGKDALVEAVILREVRRFQADLLAAVTPLGDPEDQLVEGVVFTISTVRGHPLLQRLLQTEPEELLPYFTVQGGPLLAVGRGLLAARMAEELDDGRTFDQLLVAADVVARLMVSLVLSPPDLVDLDDPQAVRTFARRFLVPLLRTSGTQ